VNALEERAAGHLLHETARAKQQAELGYDVLHHKNKSAISE
jgi:hypothetical protein